VKPFEQRLAKGNVWLEEVKQLLERRGLRTVLIGAEHVAPEVHKALSDMRNPDATAMFVRYLPDGFAVNIGTEEAFFFDAKAGKTIEKKAYETYLDFAGKDRKVFIFIRNSKGETYCVPVRELRFRNSQEVVAKYNFQLPIDEGGWIAPRLLNEEDYRRWKKRHPEASGTPYRYFDFDAMKQYKIGRYD
jgi:hypothetical protein